MATVRPNGLVRSLPSLRVLKAAGFYAAVEPWRWPCGPQTKSPGVSDLQGFAVWCLPVLYFRHDFSGASFEELRNRKNYPTGINNGPMPMPIFAEVLMSMFSYFSWTSITLLLDSGAKSPFYKAWSGALINLVAQMKARTVTLEIQTFNSSATMAYKALLSRARKVSRGKLRTTLLSRSSQPASHNRTRCARTKLRGSLLKKFSHGHHR